MTEWTRVESYKEIPEGLWLVKVEKPSHGLDIHTASIRPNVQVIAGLFAFDQRRVIAYAPLPECDIAGNTE